MRGTAGMRLGLGAIGAALVAGLAAPAGVARADAVRLKVQSAYNLRLPIAGETIRHLAETVEKARGGDLRLRVYDAGKLVPPLQVFDAVASGRIDAGFSWPGYWMGKLPAATVFAAVPFGPEPDEYLAWIHAGGGLELWRELYAPHGLVPLPCGILPAEASGWFSEPIESAADLKGLKIRYAGLGGKVMEKLGASVTMLAAGDIFLSLERGVIDATEYSTPAMDRPLGFHKVAKHYYFPGWHQPASVLELIVNEKKWASMSPDQRRFLETACDAATIFSIARGLAAQADAMAFYRDEGVRIHRWPPELMARFREAADEVMAEASAADPAFAEAWASLRAFREKHADWAGLAYAR